MGRADRQEPRRGGHGPHRRANGAGPDDGIFFAAGKEAEAAKLAGAARTRVAEQLDLIEKGSFRFCWIVDFPMFEYNDDQKKIDFSHNPFSMPQGGMEALENKDPLEILAWQYDIVCNGVELSSGAIRNHRPDIMYKAFEIAGYSREEVDTNFAGMINAFKFGAPPHGGSAPGIDRIVMLLADEPNIREVILFPMNQKAEDLMMNAPSEVTRQAAQGAQHQSRAAELEAPQKETKSTRFGGQADCPRATARLVLPAWGIHRSSIRARPLLLCASIWRSFSCRRSRIGAVASSCSRGPRDRARNMR